MSKLVPLRLVYGAEIGPHCMEDFYLFTISSLSNSNLSGLLSRCLMACVWLGSPISYCAVCVCPPRAHAQASPCLLVWRGAKLTPLTSAGEHLSCWYLYKGISKTAGLTHQNTDAGSYISQGEFSHNCLQSFAMCLAEELC